MSWAEQQILLVKINELNNQADDVCELLVKIGNNQVIGSTLLSPYAPGPCEVKQEDNNQAHQ
jgi:hypothetical protein